MSKSTEEMCEQCFHRSVKYSNHSSRFTLQNWKATCVKSVCAELYLSTNLKHLKVSNVKFMYENVHMTKH